VSKRITDTTKADNNTYHHLNIRSSDFVNWKVNFECCLNAEEENEWHHILYAQLSTIRPIILYVFCVCMLVICVWVVSIVLNVFLLHPEEDTKEKIISNRITAKCLEISKKIELSNVIVFTFTYTYMNRLNCGWLKNRKKKQVCAFTKSLDSAENHTYKLNKQCVLGVK